MQSLLNNSGWEAYAVTSAREGLEVMQAIEPECVVLDYLMPEMDGVDVLKAMRLQKKLDRLPVLFYSGTIDECRRREAMSLGATDWLPKALGPLRVVGTIAQLTRGDC